MKILSSKGHISNFKAGDELVRTKPAEVEDGFLDPSYMKNQNQGRIELVKIDKNHIYYTRPDHYLPEREKMIFKMPMKEWGFNWEKYKP